VSKWGVPGPGLIFLPKIHWWKVLYMRAFCHGARSTFWQTLLALHNEPAVSDVLELENEISG
jgi:hypothetical protein